MSIAASVNKIIDRTPTGRIFGYEVFPEYRESPVAVVRAVNRGVETAVYSGSRRDVSTSPAKARSATFPSATRSACAMRCTATDGGSATLPDPRSTTAWD